MHKHLTAEQRLEILRKGDSERKWYSLDDKRVCVVCDRVLTGRQVEIHRDQRGRYLLRCPTEGCPSYVAHWFYVGNPAAAARVLQSGLNDRDHSGDAGRRVIAA
jgi:hypothetical protein